MSKQPENKAPKKPSKKPIHKDKAREMDKAQGPEKGRDGEKLSSKKGLHQGIKTFPTLRWSNRKLPWIFWVVALLSLCLMALVWIHGRFNEVPSPYRLTIPRVQASQQSASIESDTKTEPHSLANEESVLSTLRRPVALGIGMMESHISDSVGAPRDVEVIEVRGEDLEKVTPDVLEEKIAQEVIQEVNREIEALEFQISQIRQSRDALRQRISLVKDLMVIKEVFRQGNSVADLLDKFTERFLNAPPQVKAATDSLTLLLKKTPDYDRISPYELWSSFPQVLDSMSVVIRPKPKTHWERVSRFVTDRVSVRPMAYDKESGSLWQQVLELQYLAQKGDLKGIIRNLEALNAKETSGVREWLEKAQRAVAIEEAFTGLEQTLLGGFAHRE